MVYKNYDYAVITKFQISGHKALSLKAIERLDVAIALYLNHMGRSPIYPFKLDRFNPSHLYPNISPPFAHPYRPDRNSSTQSEDCLLLLDTGFLNGRSHGTFPMPE